MSLVVTVYVPSGIVMAGDSRMTGTFSEERAEGEKKVQVQQELVLSDNAYKVVDLSKVSAGVSAYDSGILENQPMEAHIRRFEEQALGAKDDVTVVAEKLLAYFQERYPKAGVGFHIGGYRLENKVSVPYVLVGHTTQDPKAHRVNLREDGNLQYGISFSGDGLVTMRLIDPKRPPLFDAMPLQDAVDYAVHVIRTTIQTMRFEPRYPSVGGPIDVLVVKPDGMQWVQRKHLRGE